MGWGVGVRAEAYMSSACEPGGASALPQSVSQGGLVSLDHTAMTPVEGVDAPSRKMSTTARASGLDTCCSDVCTPARVLGLGLGPRSLRYGVGLTLALALTLTLALP